MTTGVVDVLAIGAHPDDVELTVGGTLLLAKARGLSFAICHMTGGEMGSRGSREIRAEEARAASRSLGAADMTILDHPDGAVAADAHTKESIVRLFRRYRPRVVLAPPPSDLHPDHASTGRAVKEAWFLAGLAKYDTGQEPWRPHGVLHYMQHESFEPTIIVDITEHIDAKKAAAQCYRSQFHDQSSDDSPGTFISRPDFWFFWEARAAWWGHFIGVKYGEPFAAAGPVPTRNPFDLFTGFGKYENP